MSIEQDVEASLKRAREIADKRTLQGWLHSMVIQHSPEDLKIFLQIYGKQVDINLVGDKEQPPLALMINETGLKKYKASRVFAILMNAGADPWMRHTQSDPRTIVQRLVDILHYADEDYTRKAFFLRGDSFSIKENCERILGLIRQKYPNYIMPSPTLPKAAPTTAATSGSHTFASVSSLPKRPLGSKTGETALTQSIVLPFSGKKGPT